MLYCRLAGQNQNYVVTSGISTLDNQMYAVSIAYSQFPTSVKVN